MTYSKEFYLLLGHINPAMYDVIFPMNPFAHLSAGAAKEARTAVYYQSPGSVFGTDYSGDLTVLAKLSWRMNGLVQKLQTVLTYSKLSLVQTVPSENSGGLVSEIIDDICGNGNIRFPFPPRPRGIDSKLTIEEKVGAAIVFSHAAAAAEGTAIAKTLSEGADTIFDSALAQLSESRNRPVHVAFKDVVAETSISN